MSQLARLTFVLLSSLCFAMQVQAWSNTEIQWIYGDIQAPSNQSETKTSTFTLVNASGGDGWDTFFFIDRATYNYDSQPGNNNEFVSKFFANYSLSALLDTDLSTGLLKDVGLTAGFKHAPEVDSLWIMPSLRLDFDLPGFRFANVRLGYYKHQWGGSQEANHFSVLDETDSYMINFVWDYPFEIGSSKWNIGGFVEYIAGNTQISNFGVTKKSSWVLAQPQIRLDLGHSLGHEAGKLFVGIEYQFWQNKLGNPAVDESAPQLLLAWSF